MLDGTENTEAPMEDLDPETNPAFGKERLGERLMETGPPIIVKGKVPRPGFVTRLRSVIGRWKTFLNLGPKSNIQQPPLTGKLGEIVHCLEESEATSLHDLITLTGWKRATVRGALSRLRTRGYEITMRRERGTPVYRLERR